MFLISGAAVHLLTSQAYARIDTALRPRTAKNYLSKFKLYLAFVMWHQLSLDQVDTILAFLEFLVQNGSKAHTLSSYLSVFSHYFKLLDIDTAQIVHRKVHLFIKSVSMNSSYVPKFKAIITIPTLLKLVQACDTIAYGQVYKAAFLLTFFAFLRLSNIAPVAAKSFDPTRHFLRGDVIFGPPGAHVILKWAKAMQSSSKHQVIQIPLIKHPPCALSQPLKSSSPLVMLPSPSPFSSSQNPQACLSSPPPWPVPVCLVSSHPWG